VGFAVGASCYRSASEAAPLYCASIAGVGSSGAYECVNATITGQVLSYTLRLTPTSGNVQNRAVTLTLPTCEPFDAQNVGPFLWSAFAVGVFIVCWKAIMRAWNSPETM
jgi:hypothetical protein